MKLFSLLLLSLLAGVGICADAGLGLGVAPSADSTTIVNTGSIPALTDYGPVDTQAHIRAALDLFFADATATDVNIPAIEINEQYTRELTAGQHKRLHLSPGTVLKLTSANSTTGTIFDFYSQPEWITTVSAITRTTSINLNDNSGDTASTNTVDVLTIGAAKTVTKYDVYKLTSDDTISNGKNSTNNCLLGEFVTAGLDSSGTALTLSAPIRETQDTYTTNKRIGKMINASVQVIGGQGTFDSSIAATSGQTPLIRFTGLRNCRVIDFKVTDALSQCIQFEGCYDYEVTDCTFRHALNAPTASHYGYGVDDVACDGGKVSNCNGFGVRHLFTTNSRQMTTNKTGRSYWYYGRSRNFNVGAGCTAWACSNAPYDTHDEADGGVFAGIISHGTYDGADSAGGSLQVRGMNITIVGGHGEGSYGGAILRTSKNGRLVGYSSLFCRTPAFVTGPGNSTTTQNCEACAAESRFGVLDVDQPVANISAGSGKTNKTEIIGGTLEVRSSTALTYTAVIKCNSTGVDLYLDDVLIDLTNMASSSTVAGIISVVDGVKVRGKIRIKNTANCTVASILKVPSGTANADVDLIVEYVSTGTNGITNCTTALPHGVNTTTFTAAKLSVTITPTGGTALTTKRTVLTSAVVSAGATLNLKGNGEKDALYRLQPAAELSGSSNGILLTASDLADGMTRTFQNDSLFILQFRSGLNFTLAPDASVTVEGTGSTLVVIGGRPTYAPIDKTASFTFGQRDNGGAFGLNNAANTQVVTLPNSASIGTKTRWIQTGAGYWSFTAASGATIRGSAQTRGQYTTGWMEVTSNTDGASAVWQLAHDDNRNGWFAAVAASFSQASSSGTGETTVATISIPANLGVVAGSRIRITTRWVGTGTAGTKTARVKIGSTALLARGETTNTNHGTRVTEIWVISNASWKSGPSGSASDFTGSTGANITGSDDLTGAWTLTLTAQATAGDALTLDGYAVEVINP